MKNLNLLPTDKPSVLGRFIDTNNLFLRVSNDIPRGEDVNIYITSDEKIKNRDWCLYNKNHNSRNPDWILTKCGEIESEEMHPISEGKLLLWMKKIILTTDQELIKDGVQSIDEEFLEWFVSVPYGEIKEIEVEDNREMSNEFIELDTMPYKIIIPKEELKQEITIEEIEQQITITEARGERVVKYLDKYKGQSIYNEIALAIEFGYQLKLEEDE